MVEESWALVEDGLISEADFSDIAFGNAVRVHGGKNTRFFFEGTAVEDAAARVVRESP